MRLDNMESKVCIVSSSKRNHSEDDEDSKDTKQKRRHNSRDRHSTKDNYDNFGSRKRAELKVGDPYYSGGTLTNSYKDDGQYDDESRHRRRHRSRDRKEKENVSKNVENQKEEKIGAPYYLGGDAVIERESGEESSNDDEKIGQRYYSTETADTQKKNSENYWNKYAKKDKKPNVCLLYIIT